MLQPQFRFSLRALGDERVTKCLAAVNMSGDRGTSMHEVYWNGADKSTGELKLLHKICVVGTLKSNYSMVLCTK